MPNSAPTVIADAECLLLAVLCNATGVLIVVKSEMVRYTSRLFEPVRQVLETRCRSGEVTEEFDTDRLAGGRGSVSVYLLEQPAELPLQRLKMIHA